MSDAAQHYPELIERWRRACVDYDGSIIVDGADPVTVPNCGDLRELTAAIAALLAERDTALLRNEKLLASKQRMHQNWHDECWRADEAEDRADTLAKRCEVLEAALRNLVDSLASAALPAFTDPAHHREVKALGKRIGFGALISTASAGWRESAFERGDPAGGEFAVGPCFGVLTKDLDQARRALSPAPEPRNPE